MKKQLLIIAAILLFLTLGTVVAVLYGQGYRFGFNNGKFDVAGTGLLVATSTPDGAQVFVNGHLTTATNNTINLAPGDYTVKIFKDGYFPWEKKIHVEKEVVSKAEALLFPKAPRLDSLTADGVHNPTIDPSATKLAYVISSQSAKKNGVYVLDMTSRPVITLQSSATQIADETVNSFSNANLTWSPTGKELLASISSQIQGETDYLLNAASFNQSPQDVTATLPNVQAQWEKEKQQLITAKLASTRKILRDKLLPNFHILAWSPDETKILYQASTSANLPIIITPRLIGTNSTSEQRQLEKDALYVYDLQEDRNYPLPVPNDLQTQSLQWFGDHLLYLHDKQIDIMEFDGGNKTTVYAGPFIDNYVFPWPNGSQIVILTNLGNPESPANLYTIGLK